MSIGLTVDGQEVVLPPGVAIRYEDRNDVLNFEVVEPSYSWPFNLATEPNARVFGFPERIDGLQHNLRTYDAKLKLNGNEWKSGLLDVTEADEDATVVNFRNRAGVLTDYKDVLISELVKKVIVPPTTNVAEMDTYNAAADSPMVFPKFHLHGYMRMFNDDVPAGEYVIPWFRLAHVLRWICEGIDYVFVDKLSSHDKDFRKWCIFHNRRMDTLYLIRDGVSSDKKLPASIKVADFLPPMTFGDLLRSIMALNGVQVDVDNEARVISVLGISRLLNKPVHVDLTERVGAGVRSERNAKKDVNLSFDDPGDGFLNLEDPEGNFKGELDSSADLAGVVAPSVGDYYLVKLENMYYKYVFDDLDDVEKWVEYLSPFQGRTGRDGDSLVSKLVPCHKMRVLEHYPVKGSTDYKRQGGSFSIADNGSGKVRISPKPSGATLALTVRLMEQDIYHDDVYYDITVLSNSPSYIDIDLNYTDETSCKIIFGEERDYYFPVVEGDFDFPEQNLSGASIGSRIAIYHGLQEEISTTDTYAYASCDAYNSKGVKVGNEAIRWHHSDSLVKTYWKSVLQFINQTRVLTGVFSMNVTELLSFDIFTKVRIHNVDMLVRLLKSVHTTDGLEEQEFEGYKVG